MLSESKQKAIVDIWNNYNSTKVVVKDTKGNDLDNIDELRVVCIEQLKEIVNEYIRSNITVGQFKTALDSFNKRNNHWGFTATKGQMFFNQLVRSAITDEDSLNKILKDVIKIPADINEAERKIDILDKYCQKYFNNAKDKRTVPNPKSVCYFLSYFWQIFNYKKWPIMYTSLIEAFTEIGIWSDFDSQSNTYKYFLNINNEICVLLSKKANKLIDYWDIEHAFWNYKGNPNKQSKKKVETPNAQKVITTNIEISEYIIPKISKLVEIGNDKEQSSAKKGYQFEQLVAEAFKQLDFEVEIYGQGSGRNPDVIIKNREQNTAFLVDAKAYSEGYSLGLDDRAIKEYINTHCPKLMKDGYKKIGFILVCNSFNSNLDEFINELTWNTEIKRFVLLTSEALLYLVAYKTRDKQSLQTIIDSIVSIENPITYEKVVSQFEDV
ncbi:hypothetical protein SPIRO4BDMA_80157 [uncultured spirochete]|jgi:hypothetical protein|uniref:FokI cleavage domain-containing protein n=1 Tax=uncultured spirochete TaxID=156406 RepID=A0A3P3XUT4_9SPIR|nr:hypothetical protein SPIRO4BDMA_80157 [uncultured spirochete]